MFGYDIDIALYIYLHCRTVWSIARIRRHIPPQAAFINLVVIIVPDDSKTNNTPASESHTYTYIICARRKREK